MPKSTIGSILLFCFFLFGINAIAQEGLPFSYQDSSLEQGQVHIADIHYHLSMRGGLADSPTSNSEYDSLLYFLKSNQELSIEIAVHMDYRSKDEAGQRLALAWAEALKDSLVKDGVDSNRLVTQGYNGSAPRVVDTLLHKSYPFLPIGQVLSQAFVKTLDPEQQELSNAINRRTELVIIGL